MLCSRAMPESIAIVASRAELESTVAELKRHAWFALDTEFIRESTYWPVLCLIQVATEDTVACIDPLACESLEPLFAILRDPSITKVLHAAEQDLEIFHHLTGEVPQPVFDTQVAAPLLGHPEQVGFGKLVEAMLDVRLAKGHARTDWRERPLPPAALAYAADESRLQFFLNGKPVDSKNNVRVSGSARPAPVAIGGRVSSDDASDAAATIAGFSGWMDEVRIWPEARAEADIRRMMRRSLGTDAGADRVVLSFDEPVPDGVLARRTAAIERQPTDLTFRQPVKDLRATVQQQRIRLSWTAPQSEVEAFVIERSTDGQRFAEVERVPPSTIAAEETQDGTRYTYTDRVRQQFTDGAERVSGTLKVGLGGGQASNVQLIGNFPNPFSETTTIAFEVRERQEVHLSVWDLSGHRLAELVNETKAPGYYEMPFQANNLPSGTYFVRLQTPEQTASHKMILLK